MEIKTNGPVSVGAVTVPDMTPAIEAIDLVKRFGGTAFDRPAVDGVSFAVPPGTVLGPMKVAQISTPQAGMGCCGKYEEIPRPAGSPLGNSVACN